MVKDLADLAKGIRYAENEEAYIAEELSIIATECRENDNKTKTEAIRKLTYLYLLGYDIKSYAFNAIECMSSNDYDVKKNGYFASYFSFGSADMATLSTNLYINDLKNKSYSIKSAALSSLASCPSTNESEFSTVMPVLFDEINILISNNNNVELLNKFLATITRFLSLAKEEDIDVDEYPEEFVDIIYNLANENIITADVMTTQIFAHVSLEIAKCFGCDLVMKIVPQAFDILITAKEPWILLDVVKFFAYISKYDNRINDKISKYFSELLQTTESKSLEIELCKAIAEGFGDSREMVLMAIRKMSSYIVGGDNIYTDENLKILAIKNIALLQRKERGIVGEIPGLTSILIKLLDDYDFSIKIAILEVIRGMSNEEILMNITNKLVASLKDIKTQNSGESIKDLHQVSPTDILEYKRKIIETIVDICSEYNYSNVTDFEWLIDIFITLLMDYPAISADLVSIKLLDLTLKSNELRAIIARVVFIVLRNKQFENTISLSTYASKISSINLVGAVVPEESLPLKEEIILFNKILASQYSTSEEESAEIVDAIFEKFYKISEGNSEVKFLYEQFYSLMEANNCISHKPQTEEDIMFSTEDKVIRADEMRNVEAYSQMMQISAWIIGICMQYQELSEDALNINSALEILTEGYIIKYPNDAILTYLTSAVRIFISLTVSFENALIDAETSKCFPEGWFSEIFRISNGGEFNSHESLVRTFLYSYNLLLERLPTFIESAELEEAISALLSLVKQYSGILSKAVESLKSDSTKDELKKELGKVFDEFEKQPEDFITFNPEVSSTESRTPQHPAFSFEDGKIFSIDEDDTYLMNNEDLFDYEPEEYTVESVIKKHHRSQENLLQFVEEPIEENPLLDNNEGRKSDSYHKNEIDSIFGGNEPKPSVKSAFIIDKSKLSKKENIETNKYTSQLKIGGININQQNSPKPLTSIEKPSANENVEVEAEKKKRKHRKHHEKSDVVSTNNMDGKEADQQNEEPEQPEEHKIEVPGEQPETGAEQNEKQNLVNDDDMLNLLG